MNLSLGCCLPLSQRNNTWPRCFPPEAPRPRPRRDCLQRDMSITPASKRTASLPHGWRRALRRRGDSPCLRASNPQLVAILGLEYQRHDRVVATWRRPSAVPIAIIATQLHRHPDRTAERPPPTRLYTERTAERRLCDRMPKPTTRPNRGPGGLETPSRHV